MLQTIRDRLSGPIIWVVIGLIAVPFAFFGIETFRSGGADPVVVKVGKQNITQSQLDAAYQQRLQRLQQMLGENFRSDMVDPVAFRAGVLNEMVQQTTLQQHGEKRGYVASDGEVLDAIHAIPAFQKDGKFSAELYRQLLAANRMTAARFETQVREGLAQDAIRNGVVGTAFVTPAEAAAAWRLSRQERSFSAVTFKPEAFKSAVTVSDDELKQYFAAHADRYRAPERLKLQYVELALDQLPPAAAPEPAVLKALYDADTKPFSSPEERHARHILIRFGADKQAAKKKAEDLKAKLDGGASFAALAKEYSEDPGSKDAGGDLGAVHKGLMTAAFENALFKLAAGEISAPVETEFGWHIILCESIKPALVKPFEDAGVQAELLGSYRRRDAEKRFQDLSEKMEQTAFENPSSLDATAKVINAKVQTTDWITRTAGTGIASTPAVLTAAFAPEVIKDGDNSKPITLPDNRVVVIRKAEYEPDRTRTLDEVKDAARSDLTLEKEQAAAADKAQALLKSLQEGATLSSQAQGLETQSPGLVRRDATGIDRKLLDAVFRLARPAAGKSTFGTVTLDGGAVAVVALDTVKDGTPDDADPAYKQQAAQLKDALAGAEFAGFRSDVEKSVGVKHLMSKPETAAEAPAK